MYGLRCLLRKQVAYIHYKKEDVRGMQEKDVVSIDFFEDPIRFADLVNGYIYHGEELIKPEDICEISRSSARIERKGKTPKAQVITADLVCKMTHAIPRLAQITLIALESQSDIHYAMPVRVMNVEGANYHQQWRRRANFHKQQKDLEGAEFLSGFQKTDSLTPVVTITIYWGTEEWDGATSLHGMFHKKIDERLLKYIPNCEIALITPNTVKDFSKFRTPLGDVLELIKKSTDKKAFYDFIMENPHFRNVDNETVSAINVFTGMNIPVDEKKEGIDMCKALEDLKLEYIEQGIERGIEQGIRKSIEKMLKNGRTPEQIVEFCGYSIDEILSVKQSIL